MHSTGHFRIYHNTLFYPSKILPKHCLQFLLGLTYDKFKRMPMQNFGGIKKVLSNGKFESGLLNEVVYVHLEKELPRISNMYGVLHFFNCKLKHPNKRLYHGS